MKYKKILRDMKCDSWEQAYSKALRIQNMEGMQIGKLVPIGSWILNDQDKIKQMCDWRQRAMRMFLTQFMSTPERTLQYLKNLSISEPGRILFVLLDGEDHFVGHLGIADVDGQNGELDNLMRGLEGGDPRLIYYSEVCLINWCIHTLDIKRISVRVVSYNWLVIDLHEEVGFEITEKLALKKHEKDGFIFHDVVSPDEANVKYACTKMHLSRDAFKRKVPWIEKTND